MTAGLIAVVAGCFQPSHGRGGILTDLMGGDWSVAIAGTGYEIGRSPDHWGDFHVFRWAPAPFAAEPGSKVIHEAVRDVTAFSTEGQWILARKTVGGFAWIDTASHEVEQVANDDELRARAPASVQKLLGSLRVPRPSMRQHLYLLGGGLVMAGIIAWLRRRSAPGGSGDARSLWSAGRPLLVFAFCCFCVFAFPGYARAHPPIP
jgi:hypothetical protein